MSRDFSSKLLWVAAGFALGSTPLLAHHSNALVDKDKMITETGVVTKFAFAQPHVSIYFDVSDPNGSVTHYYAGGASPTVLGKIGWTNKTVKIGEKIVVQGNPSRDGRPLMSFRGLYRCDGGQEIPTSGDPDAPVREYVTRVAAAKLDAAQVTKMCAGA